MLHGANHSFEATSFFDAEGSAPGVGQTIIAFAPGVVSGGNFADRLEVLIGAIEAQDGARLPGSRRLAAREKAQGGGVKIPSHLLEEIRNTGST